MVQVVVVVIVVVYQTVKEQGLLMKLAEEGQHFLKPITRSQPT